MARLTWPSTHERTPADEREPYPHRFSTDLHDAIDNILDELERLDAEEIRIETNAAHHTRNPYYPNKNDDPDDPSVVVRYEREGNEYVVPCDRWDNLRDNAQAIYRYLDSKRAIRRYGVSTAEDEYETLRLPAGTDDTGATPLGDGQPAEKSPSEILGVPEDADAETIKSNARTLKAIYHPDRGGTREQFQRINEAEEELLARAAP